MLIMLLREMIKADVENEHGIKIEKTLREFKEKFNRSLQNAMKKLKSAIENVTASIDKDKQMSESDKKKKKDDLNIVSSNEPKVPNNIFSNIGTIITALTTKHKEIETKVKKDAAKSQAKAKKDAAESAKRSAAENIASDKKHDADVKAFKAKVEADRVRRHNACARDIQCNRSVLIGNKPLDSYPGFSRPVHFEERAAELNVEI